MGGFICNPKEDNSTGKPKHNQNNKNGKDKEIKGVQESKQVEKSRVNDNDKSILEVKARMRKLKTYIDKLNIDVDKQKEKIQEHLKDKNKSRALIALKHRKFIEKELDKAFGAQTMLEQTIRNIESAAMDVNIFEAMQQGDKVLTELQKQVSMEDWEELYDKHKEHEARQEMERELFGQVLNDDELQDELDKLDAIIFEEQMPDAEDNIISNKEAKAYRQEKGLDNDEEEEAPAQPSNNKKQLAYA